MSYFDDEDYEDDIDDIEDDEDFDDIAKESSIRCKQCDIHVAVLYSDDGDLFSFESKHSIEYCPYCGDRV